MLGDGFERFVERDDLALVRRRSTHGAPAQVLFRVRTGSASGAHLEANVTDLRGDRQVRGVVLNARDVTERVRLEEELTRQAFHDGLTGLANRALFRDRLDHALAQGAAFARSSLAVLLVDLDGFKQVNDSLGHDAGDQLLAADRRAVRRRSPGPSDTLARLGGDEFALLLEGADEATATGVARAAPRARSPSRSRSPVGACGSARASGSSPTPAGRRRQRRR